MKSDLPEAGSGHPPALRRPDHRSGLALGVTATALPALLYRTLHGERDEAVCPELRAEQPSSIGGHGAGGGMRWPPPRTLCTLHFTSVDGTVRLVDPRSRFFSMAFCVMYCMRGYVLSERVSPFAARV